MKEFFKLFLYGLLLVCLVVSGMTFIGVAGITVFIEIPLMTGMKAVGMFVLSLMSFIVGVLHILFLGVIHTQALKSVGREA